MSSFSFTNRLIPLPDTSEKSVLIRQALHLEVLVLQARLMSHIKEDIPDPVECSELVDECLGLALGAVDEHSSEKHKILATNLRHVLASCEGLRSDASWADILNANMARWFSALEICADTKALSFDKLSYLVDEERRLENALAYKLDPNADWEAIFAATLKLERETKQIGEALKARNWSTPGAGGVLLTALVCKALEVRAESIDIKVLFQFLIKIEVTPYPNLTLGEINDRICAWRAVHLDAVEAKFKRESKALLFEDFFEFALGYSYRNGRDDADIHLDRTRS